MKKKIICVISARGSSKGLANKNIKKGLSMLLQKIINYSQLRLSKFYKKNLHLNIQYN